MRAAIPRGIPPWAYRVPWSWVVAVRQIPSEFGPWCSDDEYAIAEVRRADGSRWYAIPFRVIPARGQSTEDVIESGSKEPWDVLQKDPSGS